MSLTASLTLAVAARLGAQADLAEAKSALSKSYGVSLVTGTGAGQADVLWHDQRTLAPSASEDLDLAGSLGGLLGGTAVFARVKGLVIAGAASNTNNVLVGANVVNGWAALIGPTGASGGVVTVQPGGFFAISTPSAAGGVVTPATGDLLHVVNSGGGTPVTYDVIVIGASA